MRWIMIIAISAALAACAQPSPRAPEPQPTRIFTVYFDTDSADLTPTAQEIIGNVGDALRKALPSKIIVEGQANAGAPRDAELAVQRADTVVAALVKAGVDSNTIVRRTALVGPATSDPITRVSTQKVLVEFLP
jgi:outer membrane protein OmpA-like peptidoglycan-associated protein